LASLAGVSLSTVERIERGEAVTADLIDRVGQVLGYDAGYLTAPRTPIDPETAIEGFVETYEHLQPVTVAPIRMIPAIAADHHSVYGEVYWHDD